MSRGSKISYVLRIPVSLRVQKLAGGRATYTNTMRTAFALLSAALALLSVSALPNPSPMEDGTGIAALALRGSSASCVPGSFYNSSAGACSLCAPGSYQPYAGQAFCYGAPSGRFAAVPGQAGVCGACCGWATLPGKTNYNTGVYKCVGAAPYAGRASGSGCVAGYQGCAPVATCAMSVVNGTWVCPDQTFN
ncbi:hypothetical protein FB451DRAFT_1416176 [Mycena latifolia]|nr:hypothetical protein FB451DRAFT_1416176 [Mycena latifolia]